MPRPKSVIGSCSCSPALSKQTHQKVKSSQVKWNGRHPLMVFISLQDAQTVVVTLETMMATMTTSILSVDGGDCNGWRSDSLRASIMDCVLNKFYCHFYFLFSHFIIYRLSFKAFTCIISLFPNSFTVFLLFFLYSIYRDLCIQLSISFFLSFFLSFFSIITVLPSFPYLSIYLSILFNSEETSDCN